MCRRSRFVMLGFFLVICLSLTGVVWADDDDDDDDDYWGGRIPESKTVRVYCGSWWSGSINKALETPAEELAIEIHGMCTEDVVISRDNVTLLGADPESDGIQSEVEGKGAALTVIGSRFVTVENLTLNGGFKLPSASSAVLSNCLTTGQTLVANFSNLILKQSTLSNRLYVVDHSQAKVLQSTVGNFSAWNKSSILLEETTQVDKVRQSFGNDSYLRAQFDTHLSGELRFYGFSKGILSADSDIDIINGSNLKCGTGGDFFCSEYGQGGDSNCFSCPEEGPNP